MKNLRIATKEIRHIKIIKEAKKSVILTKEEIDLIKKGLHLEEMSICEILNDDILKYQHQLTVIKDLYNKFDVA